MADTRALLEIQRMREALSNQDNRATSHPIYMVQQRRRIYGMDPQWVDTVVWLDLCNDNAELTESETRELEASGTLETGDYARVGYVDEWDDVQPFFTEAGADQYIAANRHNLTDPRVFVKSAHRNPEWQSVRKTLLASPLPYNEGE